MNDDEEVVDFVMWLLIAPTFFCSKYSQIAMNIYFFANLHEQVISSVIGYPARLWNFETVMKNFYPTKSSST